jgi:hypothetical protein
MKPRGIALGRQNIKAAAPAIKSLRHADTLKSQAEIGGDSAVRHQAWCDSADVFLSLRHQPFEAEARAIPFQHGEFRCVAR